MLLRIVRILVLLMLGRIFFGLLLSGDSPLNRLVRFIAVGGLFAVTFFIQGILQALLPRLLNRLAERLSPQQLVAQVVFVGAATAAGVGGLAMFIAQRVGLVRFTGRDYFLNLGLLTVITAGVTAIYSLRTFVQRWRSARELEQELKQTVLKAEFESLKAQVNPHFLFNSLNILSALIPDDPTNAVGMVERMSKVFRYNLQNTEKATVELGAELKIVEAYLFIHKMRFGENLRYTLAVPPEAQSKQVVPQGLLTLVENALKHNECSREKPLHVRVEAAEDWVMVTNTLQRKNRLPGESTGIGLSNLRHRYALLNNRDVVVAETGREFVVKLPLLPGPPTPEGRTKDQNPS